VLHFPSEEFRKLWEKIPLELNAAVRGELSARSVLVNPSGAAAGRAVVLFPGELDSVKLRDLTYALNLGNCAVLADWQDGQGTSLPEIPPGVPVQLWGFDDDGCKAVEALAALRKTGRAVEKCVLFAPEWRLDDALKTTLADAAQAGTKIVAAFPGQGFFEEEIPGVEIVAIPEAGSDEAVWLERLQQLAQ
ncbi:MAG: hypothetical protein J6Y80_05795, partial [Victivallales bacterium]|nr:hypothetical protein [Victivallales bacterium]